MADYTNPAVGTFHIDGSEFDAYAEDIPPGGLQGFVTTQEGFSEASNELITVHPTHGKAGGISDGDVADLVQANERIVRIDALLPVYLKAAEILTETRAKIDDQRQRILLNAANSVDRRAGQNPTLLAKYEKTREYRSAIAKKAQKTKKANQAGAVDGTSAPQNTPGAPPIS